MEFMQSLAKYADRLKQPYESKVMNQIKSTSLCFIDRLVLNVKISAGEGERENMGVGSGR